LFSAPKYFAGVQFTFDCSRRTCQRLVLPTSSSLAKQEVQFPALMPQNQKLMLQAAVTYLDTSTISKG